MEPLADVPDVEGNFRALRAQELVNAETWLRTASGLLRVLVPGIDARMAADSALADTVRGVVAMAVVRKLMGADRGDPSTNTDIFFTRGELTSVADEDAVAASALSPLGYFPVPVPLPRLW